MAAPHQGSCPVPLQGTPVKRLPLLGAHLADPWRERAKPLGDRAVVAHVGCCVFWVVDRYVYQNAQTEICVPKHTVTNMHSKKHNIYIIYFVSQTGLLDN